MISIHLHKKQGGFYLRTVFNVSGQDVTALFGPSGSGKTTIINMIAGIIRPDAGHVRVNDHTLFHSKRNIDLPMEDRRIGYVFQEGRLFPHLTVRANLNYGSHGVRCDRKYVRFDHVVDLLGIHDLLHRKPAKLSGGEKQRVAIGRALLTHPELLLMDEPLASLDENCKRDILPYIYKLSKEFRVPIFYVSHAWEEIEVLAKQVVFIEDGCVRDMQQVRDSTRRRFENDGISLNGEVINAETGTMCKKMDTPGVSIH